MYTEVALFNRFHGPDLITMQTNAYVTLKFKKRGRNKEKS
jgi:hypothetical protein